MPEPTRVLIVDDDSTLRETLADLLSDRGYEVTLAADGYQALERIAQAPPDVVLLDLMMPRMDGEAFLRQARARGVLGDTPVILMTAARYPERQARHLGVADWLAKPFDVEQLCSGLAGAGPENGAPPGSSRDRSA